MIQAIIISAILLTAGIIILVDYIFRRHLPIQQQPQQQQQDTLEEEFFRRRSASLTELESKVTALQGDLALLTARITALERGFQRHRARRTIHPLVRNRESP